MKRVIKMSRAWIAAFALGVSLAGCGGASDSGSTGSAGEPSYPGIAKSAVLSWNAPNSRVNGDGIKMAELDKYIIRYGQNAEDLDREIVISDAQADAHMTHQVSGLNEGVWYFTILVQDNSGLLSAPSAIVNKEIKS